MGSTGWRVISRATPSETLNDTMRGAVRSRIRTAPSILSMRTDGFVTSALMFAFERGFRREARSLGMLRARRYLHDQVIDFYYAPHEGEILLPFSRLMS